MARSTFIFVLLTTLYAVVSTRDISPNEIHEVLQGASPDDIVPEHPVVWPASDSALDQQSAEQSPPSVCRDTRRQNDCPKYQRYCADAKYKVYMTEHCARTCGYCHYTTPPPTPPTLPPTAWPTRPGDKPPHLVKEGYICWKQIRIVCKTCTAQQCVGMAQHDRTCSRGDGSVMWSPRNNKAWGCRCCQKPRYDAPPTALHRNKDWQLWAGGDYTKPPAPPAPPPRKARVINHAAGVGEKPKLAYRGHVCASQAAYLGRHLKSVQQCLDKARKDRRCTKKWNGYSHGQPHIMFAPQYNRYLGCRCCRGSNAGGKNSNWDMYK